ncbi:MAG: cryptochrome/photolyase family protein [Alphaproteobacteria bacterium]
MRNLVYILGDQLNLNISSLQNFDKKQDAILMTEIWDETNYVKHHKKKLVLILSAMREFADLLRQNNFKVFYKKLDDEKNFSSFDKELDNFILKHQPQKIILTEPSEYRVLQIFNNYFLSHKIANEIRNDDRFLCSHHEFASYAKDKKNLLLENFYHLMRQKTKILMEENKSSKKNSPNLKPVGGKWNYDKENRGTMPNEVQPPKIKRLKINKNTEEVIKLVEKYFPKNFGSLQDFNFATNHHDAEIIFADFIKNRLNNFGIYQDAMREDVDFGFHSVISMYINIGLLDSLYCAKKVEAEYHLGNCDLAGAEGFIRQIIGWREYIRGIYWHFMPKYADLNYFNHRRNLPEFYWDEDKTEMNCLKTAIKHTRLHAYSHHIQRLMITGNFALLAQINPTQVDEWYLAVYADAFEWVEMPNTRGMALYADGGIVASKPYCSSGNYINKMSNFCKNCHYDVKLATGEKACPFNYLYWNFLIENSENLKNNGRLFYPYSNLKRKSAKEIAEIKTSAQNFFKKIKI